METAAFVSFVRERGLAVLATRSADGAPEAALIGVAATDDGELVSDTSSRSRKFGNLTEDPRVALVIGFQDDVTVQCEGVSDLPVGSDRTRCLEAYFGKYPEGRERASDPDIVHVRVRPGWLRYCDYRPHSFQVQETRFT